MTSIEQEKQKQEHIDKLLNNTGFVTFLARVKESGRDVNLDDPKQVEMIEKVFDIKNRVSNELIKFFVESLNEGGLDVSVKKPDKTTNPSDPSVKAVLEHVDRLAISEPEKLIEYHDTILRFKNLPEEIETKEKEIEKYRENGEVYNSEEKSLRESAHRLSFAQQFNTLSWIGDLMGVESSVKKARAHRELEEEYAKQGKKIGDVDIGKELTEVQKHLKEIQTRRDNGPVELDVLEKELDAKRDYLLKLIPEIKGLKEALEALVAETISKHVKEVKSRKFDRDPQKSVRRAEVMKRVRVAYDKFNTNKDLLKEMGLTDVSSLLDKKSAKGAPNFEEYMETLDKKYSGEFIFDQLVNGKTADYLTLSGLENKLGLVLNAVPLGNMDVAESVDFIASSLEEGLKVIVDPTEKSIKSIIVSRIISKLRAKHKK